MSEWLPPSVMAPDVQIPEFLIEDDILVQEAASSDLSLVSSYLEDVVCCQGRCESTH